MKIRLLLFFIFSLILTTESEGQRSYIKKGDKFFERGFYYEALSLYSVPEVLDDKNVLLRRAICNYHTNHLNQALSDINSALKLGNEDDEILLYLGKIYHSSRQFEKAISYYKDFLKQAANDKDQRQSIINDIKRCASGMRMRNKEALGFIENLGEDFNTRYDEINLIQSPNYDNKYYYSSNRERATGGKRNSKGKEDELGTYHFDMFSVENGDGFWIQTESIDPALNSPQHEIIQDFNSDGNIMYFSRGMEAGNSPILTDTFSFGEKKSPSSPMAGPILGEFGDNYLYLFNDSTILFSSRREGGYGGYDIYICGQRNGLWSKPQNLGPEINSPYDEVSPFLAANGTRLYFSSNSTKSMGGFDVFFADYNESLKKWTKSSNLGDPVNSPEDDLYFKLNSDGISATFSSNRKESLGGMDGYFLYMKKPAFTAVLRQEVPFMKVEQFLAVNLPPRNPNPEIVAPVKEESQRVEEPEIVQVEEPKEPEIVIRNIEIQPIYYNGEEDIVAGENKLKLDKLIRMLKGYPQIKMEMICYSIKEGVTAYDLYHSIKRAEKVSEYIIQQGIDPKRLILKGAGSNYPIAKSNPNGRYAAMAEKANKRFEIILHNTEGLPINITYEEPVINEYIHEKKNSIYKTIVEGLSYKVQIAAVNRMYQNEALNYYSDSMVEKDPNNGKYLYTLGLYDDYFSAKELYDDLKANDFVGMLIIPYKNGVRIARNKVIDHAREFPDLVNYLQYND